MERKPEVLRRGVVKRGVTKRIKRDDLYDAAVLCMRRKGHMAACISLKRWSKEWFRKLREELCCMGKGEKRRHQEKRGSSIT
jgi:hypothetical protein